MLGKHHHLDMNERTLKRTLKDYGLRTCRTRKRLDYARNLHWSKHPQRLQNYGTCHLELIYITFQYVHSAMETPMLPLFHSTRINFPHERLNQSSRNMSFMSKAQDMPHSSVAAERVWTSANFEHNQVFSFSIINLSIRVNIAKIAVTGRHVFKMSKLAPKRRISWFQFFASACARTPFSFCLQRANLCWQCLFDSDSLQ